MLCIEINKKYINDRNSPLWKKNTFKSNDSTPTLIMITNIHACHRTVIRLPVHVISVTLTHLSIKKTPTPTNVLVYTYKCTSAHVHLQMY